MLKKLALLIFKRTHPILVKLFKNTFIQQMKITTLIYERVMKIVSKSAKGENTPIEFRGCSFFLQLNDITILPSLITGRYEEQELNWLSDTVERKLPNSTVFIDVGANVGIYSIVASSAMGNFGKVFAIEPAVENIEFLKKNLSENENKIGVVTILETAVGSFTGETRLTLDNYGGLNQVTEELTNSRVIQISRLDDLLLPKLSQHEKVIIKIDVEGFESEVIVGSTELIRQYVPDLLIEVSPHSTNLTDDAIRFLAEFYSEGILYYGGNKTSRINVSIHDLRKNMKYGNLSIESKH